VEQLYGGRDHLEWTELAALLSDLFPDISLALLRRTLANVRAVSTNEFWTPSDAFESQSGDCSLNVH
jgi:hypothetical protein